MQSTPYKVRITTLCMFSARAAIVKDATLTATHARDLADTESIASSGVLAPSSTCALLLCSLDMP